MKLHVVITAALALALTAGVQAAPKESYLRPETIPAPAGNAVTPERVELGKALFFDPRLSGSNWISCATCHNPALGWSDGLPTAIGFVRELSEQLDKHGILGTEAFDAIYHF